MRKLAISSLMVLFMAGLVCAVEVSVVKYDADKKEVTVKEGEKESTYKISDKVKVSLIIDKDGNTKDGTFEDLEKRLKFAGKAGKGGKGGKGGGRGNKMDITVDKDTITEVKIRGGGGKKK